MNVNPDGDRDEGEKDSDACDETHLENDKSAGKRKTGLLSTEKVKSIQITRKGGVGNVPQPFSHQTQGGMDPRGLDTFQCGPIGKGNAT